MQSLNIRLRIASFHNPRVLWVWVPVSEITITDAGLLVPFSFYLVSTFFVVTILDFRRAGFRGSFCVCRLLLGQRSHLFLFGVFGI